MIKIKSNEKIIGIILPLPEQSISHIFEGGKNILVKFTTHSPSEDSIRIRPGNKVFFYKSRSNKTVVGEARIDEIEFLLPSEVIEKYKKQLIPRPEEMSKYVRGRDGKKMLVLKLSDIIKYSSPVIMKTPMTMAGQYVTEENQKDILDMI